MLNTRTVVQGRILELPWSYGGTKKIINTISVYVDLDEWKHADASCLMVGHLE